MQNEKRNYEVIIDRYGQTDYLTPTFHQFDTETAKLTFRFLSNGSSWNIPYTRLVLIIQKPDQKEVYQDIEVFSGNTAEVILKNQALTVAGELNCQIKMYKNEILESTWSFKIKVKPSIGNEDAIESTDEYQVLQQLFIDVDSKKGEMEQTITENVAKNNGAIQQNINDNNIATQRNIDAMKDATAEAIKSIDGSSLGQLNHQVLEPNYQSFVATGFMSRVGENKTQSQNNIASTLELSDEVYESLELFDTPLTLEDVMSDKIPMTLEETMVIDNGVVPIESGFAKSAMLKGHTAVNLLLSHSPITVTGGTSKWHSAGKLMHKLDITKKYYIQCEFENDTLDLFGVTLLLRQVEANGATQYVPMTKAKEDGYLIITLDQDKPNIDNLSVYVNQTATSGTCVIKNIQIMEYQEGMEKWDIPYFEGLQSVRTPIVKTISKNLFNKDGEIEQVYVDDTGALVEGKSGGYINQLHKTNESQTVAISFTSKVGFAYIRLAEYRKDKTFITRTLIKTSPYILTLDTETDYILTSVDQNEGSFENLQIEFSSNATNYTPHQSSTLMCHEEVTLRGIGDVQDTLDGLTGEYIGRVREIVLTNDRVWELDSTKDETQVFKTYLPDLSNVRKNNVICNILPPNVSGDVEKVATAQNSFLFLALKKTKASTLDELKDYLVQNKPILQYELATPIVTKFDLTGDPFFFQDGHILLSSGNNEQSLIPTLEYTVPVNLRGQSEHNAERIRQLQEKKIDVKEANVEAIAHSIVKRNSDGNVKVGSAIEFETAGLKQKHPLQVIDDAHIKIGNRRVWDDGNLPIESGKWTPQLSGLSAHVSRQYGEYCRQGHLVYLYMEFESTQWLNHGHDMMFSGLPFASNQETPFSVEMIKGVVESTQDDYHRNIFGLVSGTTLKLYKRGLNGTWWETLKSYHEVHDHFIIRIAVTYRTT